MRAFTAALKAEGLPQTVLDARQGRRPSYTRAAPADRAAPLLESVLGAVREAGVPVVTGRFQATMDVSLVNAGPVTILLAHLRMPGIHFFLRRGDERIQQIIGFHAKAFAS